MKNLKTIIISLVFASAFVVPAGAVRPGLEDYQPPAVQQKLETYLEETVGWLILPPLLVRLIIEIVFFFLLLTIFVVLRRSHKDMRRQKEKEKMRIAKAKARIKCLDGTDKRLSSDIYEPESFTPLEREKWLREEQLKDKLEDDIMEATRKIYDLKRQWTSFLFGYVTIYLSMVGILLIAAKS